MTAVHAESEIAICGAGPVGLALALHLLRRGVAAERITLVDAKPLQQAVNDPRSIALSYGSRQLLEEVGCWPIASDPIERIHVSRRGHFGRTLIEAREHALPALGYVARYGALVKELDRALSGSRVRVLRPVHASSADERADHVEIRFAEGGSLLAQVMIQAEGGVFTEQDARARQRDYGQIGLIAHVLADAPQAGVAFERFTDEGPLALLPQEDGYALVWCVRPDTASRLYALNDDAFLAELQLAFGNRVGRFTRVSPRHAYPLGLNAHEVATARTVAIGNASQTLHPVAGQGLNLGLRDAAVLARALAEDPTPEALQRFASKRRIDRNVTISLTDALARIFASPLAPVQSALGLSLGLVDAIGPLKHALADQMMFGHR